MIESRGPLETRGGWKTLEYEIREEILIDLLVEHLPNPMLADRLESKPEQLDFEDLP